MLKEKWVRVLGVVLVVAFIGMGVSAYSYFIEPAEVSTPAISNEQTKKFSKDDENGPLYTPAESADSTTLETKELDNTHSSSAVPNKTVLPSGTSVEDQAAMDRIEKDLADKAAALAETQRARQCELIAESYPIYVNQENTIFQSNINSITSYYVGRGMGYSGAYQAAKDVESARHIQKLGQLESDHNAQITQYSCQ